MDPGSGSEIWLAIRQCFIFNCFVQVHAPARDVRARPVRSHLHHERGHSEQVPARGLGQARLLPPRILLLPVRVSKSSSFQSEVTGGVADTDPRGSALF
jgi:hypothetical protein